MAIGFFLLTHYNLAHLGHSFVGKTKLLFLSFSS